MRIAVACIQVWAQRRAQDDESPTADGYGHISEPRDDAPAGDRTGAAEIADEGIGGPGVSNPGRALDGNGLTNLDAMLVQPAQVFRFIAGGGFNKMLHTGLRQPGGLLPECT